MAIDGVPMNEERTPECIGWGCISPTSADPTPYKISNSLLENSSAFFFREMLKSKNNNKNNKKY